MNLRFINFHKLFDTTYMPLCMYALRIVGDTGLADDAVQQAMISTWQQLSSGKDITDIKSYLYRSVRNEAIHLLAASACTSCLTPDIDISVDTIDTSERDAALWEAIARLPEKCREVFLASKRDGLSHAEIAEEFGISVKTVENHMTRALRQLRASLLPYVSAGKRPFFLPFL